MRVRRPVVALGMLVAACYGERPARPVAAVFAAAGTAADSAMEAMERSTTLAFVGTLQRQGVSSALGASGRQSNWTVLVDTVLRTPASVGNFRGMTVTVEVPDTMSAAAGSVAFFLARGLVADSSMLVAEVGRFRLADLSDTTTLRSLHGRFLAAASENRDRRLRPVLDSAIAVVSGRVTAIDSATAADSASWLADPDEPRWRRATVQTSYYFRGDSAAAWPRVRLVYPEAPHTAMRAASPLSVGNRLIFSLRLIAGAVTASRLSENAPPFAVMGDLDVLPMSDSARVFRLTR